MVMMNIDRNVYEEKVLSSRLPALLCFYRNTVVHSETVNVIKELSHHFESVPFYSVQEDEHEFFFGKFHFLGTPIFIFLANGSERGRLLGSVSRDRLRVFIENNISELNTQ